MILQVWGIFSSVSAETHNPSILCAVSARLATLNFSEVFCCAELLTRVHSQLPVRFSDATGYFRRWSKKRR
jgi:hypothetical protein